MKKYYVYIMANSINSVLYIGVTNDLERRVNEHKNKLTDRFTKKYNVNKLVYYEETSEVTIAIGREKQLKNWHREWKMRLIAENNPDFRDLLPQ